MRWVIALCTVLFACGGSALEIVVELDPAMGVDQVQLYVGLGHPQNDTPELLVPPGYVYPQAPTGLYWKRDPNGSADIVDVPAGATDARFVFREGTHDHVTVIVVGLKAGTVVGAASLVDAYLESGSVRQYHVQLAPASDAFPRPARTAITVQRWGPAATDTECAHLVNPANPDNPSIYVVDHDDRDCDGFVESDDPTKNLECRPDAYPGLVRAKREAATCLRRETIPTLADKGACILGGPGCVDGRAGPGTCDPSYVCAQPQSCTECAMRADPIGCMAALPIATPETTMRLECTFFILQGQGTLEFCPGPATQPALTTELALPPTCDPEQDVLLWHPEMAKWVAASLAKSGVTLAIPKPTSTCDFSVSVSGTPPSSLPTPIRSVISVQLANGRAAALPIVFSFLNAADCTDVNTKNECHVAGEIVPPASFLDCLGAKRIEPW